MTERAIDNLTDAIAEQIAATLMALAQERRAFEARVQKLESEGCRIIDGGQIDRNKWELTDFRTGEVLAKGRMRDDPDSVDLGDCCHVDTISHETRVQPELVEGLPKSLAESIIYWTFDHEEEARAFAAVAVSRIERDQPRRSGRQ